MKKKLPRYWPFVRGIHRSPDSPHKGQWRGALMFSLICSWINGWVNNRETGDLRRHSAHSDVIVMNKMTLQVVIGSLTHWGRVTHICVGNVTTLRSDNGLSPGRCQAIIRTNADILLIWPLGTNFGETLIAILTVSFKKMRLKGSSAKWRTFNTKLISVRCSIFQNNHAHCSRYVMSMACCKTAVSPVR